jgi:hypothetical protein
MKRQRAGALHHCQPFFQAFFVENSLDTEVSGVYNIYLTDKPKACQVHEKMDKRETL